MTPSVTFAAVRRWGKRAPSESGGSGNPGAAPEQNLSNLWPGRSVYTSAKGSKGSGRPLLDAWISLKNSYKRPGSLGRAWGGAEVRGTEISNSCANSK